MSSEYLDRMLVEKRRTAAVLDWRGAELCERPGEGRDLVRHGVGEALPVFPRLELDRVHGVGGGADRHDEDVSFERAAKKFFLGVGERELFDALHRPQELGDRFLAAGE